MRLLPVLATLLALGACAAPAAAPPTTDCPAGSGAGTATVEYAENFSLRDADGYRVLTVEQPFPGGAPESYVLVACGAPEPQLPPELASTQRIETPVRSLYSASTTHLPLLADLDRLDVLTGVGTVAFVTSADVRARIEAGTVAEFAASGPVDVERVVAARPDVVMTGGVDDPAYAMLRGAGVPVVANAEYLEPTPLGRAEWIKVMAALTGDDLRAGAVFDGIEATYLDTAARAQGVPTVPVLAGHLYEGVWSAPGGGSYVGRLLADAGGANPWGDDPASSVQLDLETVLARGGSAPVWLTTQDWTARADALAADPRYGELAAMRDGRVWAANLAIGPGGGNDFYERGVTRPDLVLADLVAILHPDTLPGHEFTFYRPLT